MCMQDKDLEVLVEMVKEYSIIDLIEALEKIAFAQADELVDLGLSNKAKDLTKVAWHLSILRDKQE